MGPIRRQTSPHARRLRRERTPAEERFWLEVRDRRLDGWKFRFQCSIGPYVADFACLAAAVIVEIDGSQHSPEVDSKRIRDLERQGFLMLRFWNNEVFQNLEGVLLTVLNAVQERGVRK